MLQPGGRNRGRLSDLYHDKTESCADGQTEKESRNPDFAGQRYANDRQKCAKQQRYSFGERSGQPQHSGCRCTHDAAGIGESRAKAIISYREQHGAFAQIEDIMKISGIKQAAFSKNQRQKLQFNHRQKESGQTARNGLSGREKGETWQRKFWLWTMKS